MRPAAANSSRACAAGIPCLAPVGSRENRRPPGRSSRASSATIDGRSHGGTSCSIQWTSTTSKLAAGRPIVAHVAAAELDVRVVAQDLADHRLPARRDVHAGEVPAARLESLREVAGGGPAPAAVVEHALVAAQTHLVHVAADTAGSSSRLVKSRAASTSGAARLGRRRRAWRAAHLTSSRALARRLDGADRPADAVPPQMTIGSPHVIHAGRSASCTRQPRSPLIRPADDVQDRLLHRPLRVHGRYRRCRPAYIRPRRSGKA